MNQSELKPVKEAEADYTSRRERRSQLRADRRIGGMQWLGGALLIALGGLFLLQNAGYFPNFSNWWALFILLPAAASFAAGWGAYQRHGAWTKESVGPMLAGALFVGLTAVFLFSLDISFFGPLLLIVGGLLMFFGPR